ncbi:MAG: hypothetical protein M3278_03320 [Thermoproteota archaeon]|nr:hypothetical protein [Thermoproteota archaeon]
MVLQAKKQAAAAMDVAITIFPLSDGRFELQPFCPPVNYYRSIFDYILSS